MDAYPRLGMPAEEVAASFRQGDRVLATALNYRTGTSAGIYWVGTLTAAERRGLAEACTRSAVNDAFLRGARLVTLQASAFRLPLYQRPGFRNYDGLSFYLFSRSEVS